MTDANEPSSAPETGLSLAAQQQNEFELKKLKLGLEAQNILDARKEYARQILEYTLQYERHLKDYGQLCLRTVFLVNAGAIVALLALIGSLASKSQVSSSLMPHLFVPAFGKYVVGLTCALISMFAAYVNYSFHHAVTADPASLANNMTNPQPQWPGNHTPASMRGTNLSQLASMALGFISAGLFLWGSLQVAFVFSDAK